MNPILDRLRARVLPHGRPGPAAFALVSLVFVLAVPAWITPCFIEGDNDAIGDFAAHGFPVPYAGILLTTLLHWGYSAAPSFGWYAAALYAGHVLSLSLWLALLWRVFRPAWSAVALSLVLMLYYVRMLVFLDYTATSVMLCAAAMAWAFLDVLERRPGRLRPLLWGWVFMLGMWVRPQGATGTLAFLLPAGVWVLLLALRGHAGKAELRRLALVAFLFFVPALADLAADAALRAVTMTPQQAQYDAFNTPRGRFFRLPRVDKFRLANDGQVLDSLHWNRGDLLRVLNWTMLDERKYTPEAMRFLTAAATPKPATWKQYRAELWERLAPPDPYLLLLLAPLPLLLLAAWRRPWPALFGLVPLLWALGLVCYMSLHYAFQYRVEFPYLSAAALMGLVLAAWSAGMLEERKHVHALAAALCFAIACGGVYHLTRAEAEDGGMKVLRADLFMSKLVALQHDHPHSVILAKSDEGLPFKYLDPRTAQLPDLRPIQLGWSTFSPRFYQQIGALGVQHGYEVMDALVDRPDAYILGPRDWATELSAYLTDPRGVQAVTVMRFPDGNRLMRLVRGKH